MNRRIGLRPAVVFPIAFLLAKAACAGELKFRLTLDPGDLERSYSPVEVRLSAGKDAAQSAFTALGQNPRVRLKAIGERKEIPVQAEIVPEGAVVRFLAERLKAGKPENYELVLGGPAPGDRARFRIEKKEGFADLTYEGNPVWRFMTAYEPAHREETYKPYLHIFDSSGRKFITKGPGGLYTHHRGIFLGWNLTKSRGRVMDFWHCPDVTQKHAGYLENLEHLGPVLARAASLTEWLDGQGRPVVRDVREVSAWRLGGTDWLLDFRISLKSAAGEVELDGDPQHAGFQFRAAQEVAERKEETVYIRPAGARGGDDDVWDGCPWAACLFKIDGRPYAVMHMNHSGNPEPTVYSTRDYGRFGAFFAGRLTEDSPLHLSYRILVLGPAGRSDWNTGYFQRKYIDFTKPVASRVSRLPKDPKAANFGAELPVKPPPGAMVLFGADGLEAWAHRDGRPASWPVGQGGMETTGGDIMTKKAFKDFFLHLEFLCPGLPPEVTGQKRSNSGVYIHRRYEVQILDSFGLAPGKGECGAVYNLKAPDINACRPPDSWQSYDITFRSPRWDRKGNKIEDARITVFHNGLLIHDDARVPDKTGAGEPEGPEPGPILLQDHGDDVLFRNVWIVPREGG